MAQDPEIYLHLGCLHNNLQAANAPQSCDSLGQQVDLWHSNATHFSQF